MACLSSDYSSLPAPSLPAELLEAVGPLAESQALKHGGRQVQAVVRHRRAEAGDGKAPWLVEKRLSAPRFAPPARELLFYSRIAPFIRPKPLYLPRVYYAGRVGQADYLLLEWLEGKQPSLWNELPRVGRGIAALEASSSRWFAALTDTERKTLAPLNFFRSWGQRGGFRHAYGLYLPRLMLRNLAMSRRLLRLGGLLLRLERQVRRDPPCVCHLDLSAKNLILSEDRLAVIDWGEACLGRPGFDVGALLALLARRSRQRQHQRVRARLLKVHEAALEKRAPELLVPARRGRAYYMACSLLFYLSRGEHAERDDWLIERIEEEVEAALSQAEAPFPAPQKTPGADKRAGDDRAQRRNVEGQHEQAQGHHPEAEDRQKAEQAAQNKKHAQR